MNEESAVPAVVLMPPKEVPVRLPDAAGVYYTKPLHLLDDGELGQLAKMVGGTVGDSMAGWRWARSLAWLLAGRLPRPWTP